MRVRRLWLAGLAALSALVLGVSNASMSVAVTGSPAVDAWAQPLGDAGGGQYNAGETTINAQTAKGLSLAWQRNSRYAQAGGAAIVDGVLYTIHSPGNTRQHAQFVALDVRTGALLWSQSMPLGWYLFGVAVSGDYAVMSHIGTGYPAGVTAINIKTRAMAWHRDLGGTDNAYATRAVVDESTVLVYGALNLYGVDLATGKVLWTRPTGTDPGVDTLGGYFASGGYALVTTPSYLVALNIRTGSERWRGALGGSNQAPVVADGVVYSSWWDRVHAFRLDGCGSGIPSCDPVWTSVPGPQVTNGYGLIVSAAGGGSLYAVGQVGAKSSTQAVRLSSATGEVQWRLTLPNWSLPQRAGDLVWFSPIVDSSGVYRAKAYSAVGASTQPLANLAMQVHGVPYGFSIANGTLVVQSAVDGVFAYELPRT